MPRRLLLLPFHEKVRQLWLNAVLYPDRQLPVPAVLRLVVPRGHWL
jgi:hypothetical protein